LYVHATLLLRVRKLTAAGRLLAAALTSRHPHTLTYSYFAAAYSLNSVSVFIRLQCVGDAVSWLSGWASLCFATAFSNKMRLVFVCR